MLVIGHVMGKFVSTDQKHYQDLGSDMSSSMEFLQPLLRQHFVEKLVLVSHNAGCFLRLPRWQFLCELSNILHHSIKYSEENIRLIVLCIWQIQRDLN